jgi:hypothetical protein
MTRSFLYFIFLACFPKIIAIEQPNKETTNKGKTLLEIFVDEI